LPTESPAGEKRLGMGLHSPSLPLTFRHLIQVGWSPIKMGATAFSTAVRKK
jgi:hypothetical protein